MYNTHGSVRTSATVVIERFIWKACLMFDRVVDTDGTTLTTYTTYFHEYIMHYNKWNSSDVEHRLKQHALQTLKINLTTDAIHVWKRVGLLTGFWIKKKFQDTSLHHTSLTPSTRRWSHYLLLKENITNSLGYVGGVEMKNPFYVQMRGYL